MAGQKATWQRYRVLASTCVGLVATMWLLGGIPDVAAQSLPGVPTPSVGSLSVVQPEPQALSAGGLGLPADPPKDKSAKEGEEDQVGQDGAWKGSVDRTFEGFGFDDNATENAGFRFIPPDPIGAAGKSRVIAVVNTMIESRTKGGKLKWRDSLSDFFAPLTPTTFTFDPKIVYDQYADRFVVVTLEVVVGAAPSGPGNISRILLAVSKNGTPKSPTAADWHFQDINAKGLFLGFFDTFADYPGFEVDEEVVYVTANMFTFMPFGLFGGSRLWIVDKGTAGGFYDGGVSSVSIHDPYAETGISNLAATTMPAQVFGAGGVGPGIGTFLVEHSGLSLAGDEFVNVIRVDDPLGTPAFTQEFINVGDIDDVAAFLPDAPQSGSGVGIEVNDRRALDAVWRNDQLYLTTTILPNSGPDAGETTAYWFQLDTSAVTSSTSPAFLIALADQGDIGGEDLAAGTFTFFPAVAVNRDDEVKFGFSASAPTIFAGAFATGRQPADPPGTLRDSETIQAGRAPYKRFFGGTRNRWGDYSGIALDPTDQKKFWVFNEFADLPGSAGMGTFGPEDGRWGTIWGRTKFNGSQ